MKRVVSGILFLAVVAALAAFALKNDARVPLSLWPSDLALVVPLSLLALGCFGSGLVCGVFLAWLRSWPRALERRRLRKENTALREELARRPAPPPPPASRPLLTALSDPY